MSCSWHFCPAVEYYSIDEQFFDADYLEQAFGCPVAEAAARLQQTVLQEIGIPVSIGIAQTKTIAKLISSSSKPFGYQVITDVRENHDWQYVPIVVLSGKVLEEDIVKALDLGANDYVTKPFRPEELLARLRRVVADNERLALAR